MEARSHKATENRKMHVRCGKHIKTKGSNIYLIRVPKKTDRKYVKKKLKKLVTKK